MTADIDFLSTKCKLNTLDGLDIAMQTRAALKQQRPVVRMAPGESMWVPYGSVPIITSCSEFATFVVIPWVSKELASEHSPDVVEMIYAAFTKFLKSMGNKTPWGQMGKDWKAFRATFD